MNIELMQPDVEKKRYKTHILTKEMYSYGDLDVYETEDGVYIDGSGLKTNVFHQTKEFLSKHPELEKVYLEGFCPAALPITNSTEYSDIDKLISQEGEHFQKVAAQEDDYRQKILVEFLKTDAGKSFVKNEKDKEEFVSAHMYHVQDIVNNLNLIKENADKLSRDELVMALMTEIAKTNFVDHDERMNSDIELRMYIGQIAKEIGFGVDYPDKEQVDYYWCYKNKTMDFAQMTISLYIDHYTSGGKYGSTIHNLCEEHVAKWMKNISEIEYNSEPQCVDIPINTKINGVLYTSARISGEEYFNHINYSNAVLMQKLIEKYSIEQLLKRQYGDE